MQLDSGETIQAYPRGKKSLIACGDRVQVLCTDGHQGSIESIVERRSLLYRSDAHRQKLIAANVTQVAIVVAAVPTFYDELITRCLVAAHAQRIEALLVLNKCDLVTETRVALERLRIYETLGYKFVQLSAKTDLAPLRAHILGHRTILVGQSGMGKSTILNGLVPNAMAQVREISQALDSGKHTTTATRLYRLDEQTTIIDSPGLQEFGLAHLRQADIVAAFTEFGAFLGRCRFTNCKHLVEPGCAITQAPQCAPRLAVYQKITRELLALKDY